MRLRYATLAALVGLLLGCLSNIFLSLLPNVPLYVWLLRSAAIEAPLVYFFAIFYLEQRHGQNTTHG